MAKTEIVEFNGWQMIVPSTVAADPVELAKIRATLKMVSEIKVGDAVIG